MSVATVVVTYNRKDKLRRCLDAVIRQKGSTIPDIIIVDNNSTDGTGRRDTTMCGSWMMTVFRQMMHLRNS